MLRAFKQFSIVAAGTPQPLVSTATTAAIVASASPVNIPVGDSSLFSVNDRISIDANNLHPGLQEMKRIMTIPDATHITVPDLSFSHVSGVYVYPAYLINSLYVQTALGNTGLIYLGAQGMNKTGLVKVIATLFNATTGQPIDFSDARTFGPNPSNANEVWVDGTTGDKYQPTFGIV